MKKILLVITLSSFVLVSKTQTVSTEKNSGGIAENQEPVKLIYFFGSLSENRLLLKWNVAENESVNLFEVERSYDGKNFTAAGLLLSSEKKGNETYFFPEVLKGDETIYYCLKMVDKNQRVKYSKVLSFQPVMPTRNSLAFTSVRFTKTK